ncbi:uncharacterized protein TNCV_1439801 [Trichonephila clavipes]|nr:uncharacterized protein TNCV_1439801 [Trichonephila clavipes]
MPWPAALDYAVEDPCGEQLDQDGLTDARLGLSRVSLLARGGRETHPGALRTTHVHWQLYGTSNCPAGRCHHPEENQCACRGGHGPQGQMRTCIDPSCLPQ